MELEWRSCENGWCDLRIVKLGWSSGKGGVYIIWSGKGVVYVGQGDFEERFLKHKKDPRILRYVANKHLYVTWAVVEKDYRNGVERYLADVLEPLVEHHYPNDDPIQVNFPPWQARLHSQEPI